MSIIQDLTQNAKSYDFSQVMRLLSQLQEHTGRKLRVELKAEAMPTGETNEVQYFSLKNNRAKIRLAKEALSGVQGVIPNYIYEELLAALHRDDHALKDFLDVFNQRHFEIVNNVESQSWLLLEQEQQAEKSALLQSMAALKAEHGKWFQYSFLLSQKSRSLSVLKQILNDYFPYDISLECEYSQRRQLPLDSLTRLGCRESFNSRIGQGFLLGKTCITHFSHIKVTIAPSSRQQFVQAQSDDELTDEILSLCHYYLRDTTPVSIYLQVKRAYLTQPKLSQHRELAARLGETDYLSPAYRPNNTVKILLK